MPLEVYYRVGDGTDANDKPWEIGIMGTDVLVRTNGSLRLDGEQRDRFAKAWAEAERQAEAHLEPEVEAEIWCGLNGCVNGPGDHQWHVTCQTRAEAHPQ